MAGGAAWLVAAQCAALPVKLLAGIMSLTLVYGLVMYALGGGVEARQAVAALREGLRRRGGGGEPVGDDEP